MGTVISPQEKYLYMYFDPREFICLEPESWPSTSVTSRNPQDLENRNSEPLLQDDWPIVLESGRGMKQLF
jgi:hypothetical protein